MTTQKETCQPTSRSIRLTPRQREILNLVAEGATDNEIASRLCLSSATVSQHVKTIRVRLGVTSRTHAVALALRLGILDTNPPMQENA